MTDAMNKSLDAMDEQISAILKNVTDLLLTSRHSSKFTDEMQGTIKTTYDMMIKSSGRFLLAEMRFKIKTGIKTYTEEEIKPICDIAELHQDDEESPENLYHDAYEAYLDIFADYHDLTIDYQLPRLKQIEYTGARIE